MEENNNEEKWLSDEKEKEVAREAYRSFFKYSDDEPEYIDEIDSATLIAYSGDKFYTVTASPKQCRDDRMHILNVIRDILSNTEESAIQIIESINDVEFDKGQDDENNKGLFSLLTGIWASGGLWWMSVINFETNPQPHHGALIIIAMLLFMLFVTIVNERV